MQQQWPLKHLASTIMVRMGRAACRAAYPALHARIPTHDGLYIHRQLHSPTITIFSSFDANRLVHSDEKSCPMC